MTNNKMISVKCKCGTKTYFEIFILNDKTFRKGYCKKCGAELQLPPAFSIKSDNEFPLKTSMYSKREIELLKKKDAY